MPMFKHILVPTDFSEASPQAIDFAVSLATTFSTELTLMHTWEVPVYPYMEFVLSSAELGASVEQAAGRRLQDAVELLKKRVPWAKSVLRTGVPWREILETAKGLRADLIVMGTHGRRGLDHALLGSVAEKVVRLSAVPVLTVHAAHVSAPSLEALPSTSRRATSEPV